MRKHENVNRNYECDKFMNTMSTMKKISDKISDTFTQQTLVSAQRVGTILATNLSETKGTTKHNVGSVVVDAHGIVGDAHAGLGHRQISLLNQKDVDEFAKCSGKKRLKYGDFGENLTLSCDSEIGSFGMLDKIIIGNSQVNASISDNSGANINDNNNDSDVVLEITQIGKECHGAGCVIYREVGKCIMPRVGYFARVAQPGKIAVGNVVTRIPYVLKILVITLSDRAVAQIYSDKAGETARLMLEEFFASEATIKRAHALWHWQLEYILMADDATQLRDNLQRALDNDVDIIFTLGGTGVGARDITLEVVNPMCDKFLPGIMENIRMKYGIENPAARLSRGVAGVMQQHTQIYTLPGSARAVREYLTEIFATLEHVIFMLHGIDRHK